MKKEIFVGTVGIGGCHRVSVQTMTKLPLSRRAATIRQIERAAAAGAELVRIGLPDSDMLPPFREVTGKSPLPVIADIHFDGDLALKAMEAGAAGLRINPGNIGGNKKLDEILLEAKERRIPIRIGANSGSLNKKQAGNRSLTRAGMLVESALERIRYCEDQGFDLLKISLKSSSVRDTIDAYRLMDSRCSYPLHLGITEAGLLRPGTVKSAIGIGVLLLEGIGNTIRVSLTADPEEEVKVAWEILRALEIRRRGIELISCPTCSRTSVDLKRKVNEFQKRIEAIPRSDPLKVAIMGCEVNGPGEAAEADVGIAFSKGSAYLFTRGGRMEKVETERAMDVLLERINELRDIGPRK